MLQWMGGSRRKVNTSRKSTLNRQKQYFEQRRRQQQHQQQTNGIESYAYGSKTTGQHEKEHQSLDILSLLNLSKVSQEQKSTCPSVTYREGGEDLEVNASKVKYDIARDPLTIPSKMVVPPNSVEFNRERDELGFLLEVASPKKGISTAPDNHRKSSNEMHSKPHNSRTAVEQPPESSVLDFLGDDGMDDYKGGSPVHEAHVAFSVEGLGKVGMETPVHSPKQAGRTFSYGCSSPLHGGKKKDSFKNRKRLDDIEIEVDAVMQDVNMPLSSSGLEFSEVVMDVMDTFGNAKKKFSTLTDYKQHDGHDIPLSSSGFEFAEGVMDAVDSFGNAKSKFSTFRGHKRHDCREMPLSGRCLEFSEDVMDSFGNASTFRGHKQHGSHDMPLSSSCLEFPEHVVDSFGSAKKKLSTFGDYEQHDDHSSKFESYYGGKRMFYGIENSRRHRGDGRSSFLQESFNEWEHDLSLKNWPTEVNRRSADSLMHRDYEMSDFSFEEPFSPKRFASSTRDKFNILDSPSNSKHQPSENDLHDKISNGARYPTVGRSFDFGCVPGRPDSCFTTEYDRDNLSLLSEESCSSSAVRVNATNDSLPKSTRKLNKRTHGNSYPDPKYHVDIALTKRTQDRTGDIFQPKSTAHGSDMSKSSKSNPSYHSYSSFQEKSIPNSNFLSEERFFDINLGSNSFHQGLETKCPLAGSKPFSRDPSSVFDSPELNVDARSFKHEPVASSHSGSFISEIFTFHDSPMTSKFGIGRTKPEFFSYPDGQTPSPDLSAQESFSKDEGGKSKFQPAENSKQEEDLLTENQDAISASRPGNNNSESKQSEDAESGQEESVKTTYLPDHAEEASSYLNTPDKFKIKEKEDVSILSRDPHNSAIALPCRSWNKEVEDSEPPERMKESKKPSDFADSSCQVMMLQSYVLQFLCVQKVLKEAASQNKKK